jgi:hypothetical protein
MTKNFSIEKFAFLVIVVLYLIYAAVYIEKTSFTVGKQTYYALFDDAMISMRYAKNLAHGAGLVWNPNGERVEGFTNPLWVLLMSFFHLFPIPSSKISLFIQVCGALFLTANLFVVRKNCVIHQPQCLGRLHSCFSPLSIIHLTIGACKAWKLACSR